MNVPARRARPIAGMLVGALLLYFSQLRLGIGVLAWITPVPWLFALRHAESQRVRAAVLAAMPLVWVAIVGKIISPPMPAVVMMLAFGLPIGATLAMPYVVHAWLRPRVSPAWLVIGFGSAAVLAEWTLHALLPFGTWGSAANTQLDQRGLLQLASVTGAQGIAFLVAATAASIENWLAHRDVPARHVLAAALASVGLVVALGQARLSFASDDGADVVRVATIDTDATFAGAPLPTEDEVARIEAALAERTREVASAGARLVVWPEASTLVRPEREAQFLTWASDLARATHVRLAIGYVVPVALDPLSYRNTLVLISSTGDREPLYLKHHPVPGEPAITGMGPMPLAVDPDLGRVSGALCYDYDFPRLGLAQAALGADVVALAASDWRGIDPIHAQMVAARAIEDGVSVVRATRFGSSIIVDPHGRVRAMHSAYDRGSRTMIAEIPRHGVVTVYGTIGDALPAVLALGWVVFALSRIRAHVAAKPLATSPSSA